MAHSAEADVVDAVLDHLTRKGLVDDARCAEALARAYSGRRAAGPAKLAALLRERGAPEDFIESCLAIRSNDDSLEPMLDALRSKFRPDGDRLKAARFLLSRGFAEDNLESALDRFFGESETPS